MLNAFQPLRPFKYQWPAVFGGSLAAAIRKLFADPAVQGAWYDPSDLSTLYTERTGTLTTRPEVGNELLPVGTMLDKRLPLGAKLTTNGTFDGPLGSDNWNIAPIYTSSIAEVVGGQLKLTIPAEGVWSRVSYKGSTGVPTIVGQKYVFTCTMHNVDASAQARLKASGTMSLDSAFADSVDVLPGTTKDLKVIFTATATTTYVGVSIRGVGGEHVFVDNLFLNELPGNHAQAPSDAARPVLGREPEGGRRNLLLNTDTLATQSYTTTAVAHTLSFTGTGTVTLSGASTAGPLVGTGASNRVSLTFTPSAASLTLTVSGSVTLAQLEIGSAATAYQKVGTTALDVTEAGKRDCYYLQFNGSTTALIADPVDLSGTDKVFASAGVGFSDGTGSNLHIFQHNGFGTPQSFLLGFPGLSAAENQLRAGYRGDGTNFRATAEDNVPLANHVVALHADMAAPFIRLRRNGEQVNQTLSDPGGGNFASERLSLGARVSGAHDFYKNRIHSLVLLGRAPTEKEIETIEKFNAQKSGAELE
jgi:hypothetical protein